MEIVIDYKANGDFKVRSTTRENYRVAKVLAHVVTQMVSEMNRLNGALVTDGQHVGHFERMN